MTESFKDKIIEREERIFCRMIRKEKNVNYGDDPPSLYELRRDKVGTMWSLRLRRGAAASLRFSVVC